MRSSMIALRCAFAASFCIAFTFCGSGGGPASGANTNPAQKVSVSISPTMASLSVGATQQFTATATNATDKAVTWSVNGAKGGNSTVGTISSTGLYKAPTTVPAPASVSITATKTTDATKFATAQVTIKLKISVSPTSASVELFHAQQFSAVVVGVANTAVQWSIDGIQGGNSTVGTIGAAGLYTAPISLPSPPTITVEATSVADPSQTGSTKTSLVEDTSPPQVLSITPANGSTGIALNTSVAITFNERLEPSTLNSPTFTLTQGAESLPVTISYDPTADVVTLTPSGLLTPLTSYNLTIGTQLKELGGNSISAPFSASFTTVAGTSVPSSVTPPSGINPTSLDVVSLEGQQTSPAPDGKFTASVRPQGTTGVLAMVPGEAFGLMAISISNSESTSSALQLQTVQSQIVNNSKVFRGRWEVTASQKLAQVGPQSLVLDFQTTAESLLFLSPALFTGDPQNASAIMQVIAAEPKTQTLANALLAACNEPYPLEDPSVADAYTSALEAILSTLTQQPITATVTSNIKRSQTLTSPVPNEVVSGSSTLTYHPFDVCCVEVGSFGEQNSSWSAPAHVTGPSWQNPNGNYVGWYLRTVPLKSSDPTSIIPGLDSKGNPDSPPKQEGEDGNASVAWFASNSFVDYIDVSNALHQLSLDLLQATGIVPTDLPSNTISVPQPGNGGSATYLLRFYSGGGQLIDGNEANLVGTLPDGTDLSHDAMAVNLSGPLFGILSGAGILPKGTLPCLAEKLVQDGVFASTPQLSSSSSSDFNSTFGDVLGWTEFAGQDLISHVGDCEFQTSAGTVLDSTTHFLNMQQDIYHLTEGVASKAYLAYQIGLSAGKLTGVVGDLLFKVSPVDTAYISIAGQTGSQVASIAISPSSPPTINVGSQQPLSYIAKNSAGDVLSSVNVSWVSSNNQVATVDGNGLVKAMSPGTSLITVAALSGASASTVLTVNSLSLDHLTISPSAVTIHIGQSLPFTASGVASNGAAVALGSVTWASSALGTASVDTNGVVTGTSTGTTTITASSGGKSASAQVNVISATISQVVVAPSKANLAVGNSLQFTATAFDSSGNPISGANFTWNSSDAAVATVNTSGLSAAVAAGQTTISASSGGVTGDAALTVTSATDSNITLSATSSCPNNVPQIQLQWNSVAASTYDVYRDGSLYQSSITGPSFTDTANLVHGASYQYFVQAHLSSGGTLNSNIASATILSTCGASSGAIGVFPSSWSPVFTVGDSPTTMGFHITNQSSGTLTGTISASTSSGGQWLTAAGQASYNWTAPETVNVAANPAGLSAGPYTGSLTVSSPNASGTVTIPVTMTIYNALQITTTSLPVAIPGQPYNFQLQASGGTGTGYTWSLVSGTLPVGISFSPSGLLSGTAGSLSGSITETLKIAVQDSAGHQALNTFSLLRREGLAILPYSPSNFEFSVGSTYTAGNSITLQAAGGTSPYSWSTTGLPPGLAITPSTGLISGTPTQAGSFTANVTVHDSAGHSASSPVVFSVVVTPLTITTGTLPSGTVGVAYSQFVNAQGGSQSGYTWSVQGSLPPGLSSSTPTGGSSTAGLQISGTPTQAGTYPITVTVKDSLNDTAQQNITIVINTGSPPQITTSTLNLATVGSSYTYTLAATGGAGGYQWSFVGSSPDPGLQLSTSGVLSGTSSVPNDCPTGPDIWVGTGYPTTYFQVQVTDSAGQSAARQLCLPAYYPTPNITSLNPPSMTLDGQTHTVTINGTGFQSGAYVYNAQNVTTYVSSQALNISLAPTNPIVTDTNLQFWIVQPYSRISNKVSFTIYDPPPTISSVTAVLNNSTQPCTANSTCQLVVSGGGLVYDTAYTIADTGQSLGRAVYPSTPVPWNTVTTTAFTAPPAGTYTLNVTNPNQAGGGTATAVATFTVQ